MGSKNIKYQLFTRNERKDNNHYNRNSLNSSEVLFINKKQENSQESDSEDNIEDETTIKKYKPKSLKILYSTVSFIIALLIFFLIILSVFMFKELKFFLKTCQTADCYIVSGQIISKINLSVPPCQNFYSYACGNFKIESYNWLMDSNNVNFFTIIENRNLAVIRKKLENTNQMDDLKNSSAILKARKLFNNCMNKSSQTNSIHDIELFYKVVKTFSKSLFTYNINWDEGYWSLEEVLYVSYSYGGCPLFQIDVEPDLTNKSFNIITLRKGCLTLGEKELYLRNYKDANKRKLIDYIFANLKFINTTLKQLTQKSVDIIANDVWSFENLLAKAMSNNSRGEIMMKNEKKTIKNLQITFKNQIDWILLFSKLFRIEFDGEEYIRIDDIDYFTRLSFILKDLDKKILINYLSWNFLHNVMPALNIEISDMLSGQKSPVWKNCIQLTKYLLPYPVTSMLTNKYINQDSIDEVQTMFLKLIEILNNVLNSNKWLDLKTKTAAQKKLNSLNLMAGYPEFVKNITQLDKYYDNVLLSESFFQDFLNIRRIENGRKYLKLRSKPDLKQWKMNPSDVNAYYHSFTNQVVVSAGLLHTPFYYQDDSLRLLNFGSLGFVLAHEIIHAFDNYGRLTDESGNIRNWWSNHSDEEYVNKSNCFMNLYNEEKNANYLREKTFSENIADNGGLLLSYNAYKRWLEENQVDPVVLPGLNLTLDQQFFITFAQTWCSYSTEKVSEELLEIDEHSSPSNRVNFAVRNFQEFSKAFDCQSNSPMNSNDKCSLW